MQELLENSLEVSMRRKSLCGFGGVLIKGSENTSSCERGIYLRNLSLLSLSYCDFFSIFLMMYETTIGTFKNIPIITLPASFCSIMLVVLNKYTCSTLDHYNRIALLTPIMMVHLLTVPDEDTSEDCNEEAQRQRLYSDIEKASNASNAQQLYRDIKSASNASNAQRLSYSDLEIKNASKAQQLFSDIEIKNALIPQRLYSEIEIMMASDASTQRLYSDIEIENAWSALTAQQLYTSANRKHLIRVMHLIMAVI